jgi:hypothetical protein
MVLELLSGAEAPAPEGTEWWVKKYNVGRGAGSGAIPLPPTQNKAYYSSDSD